MSVYVDAPIWPYGRMMMCHMLADDIDSLHAMADRIGVARRWFQNKPGFPHYDICKAKRAMAVQFGAVAIDRRKFVELVKRNRAKESATVAGGEVAPCAISVTAGETAQPTPPNR